MASKELINFVILIASAGSAGAITFQAALNNTEWPALSLDVVSIVPLGMPETCFMKQSNPHNCFAGAAQVMATVCGKLISQGSCNRKQGFKGGIGECLTKNGLRSRDVGVREGSFDNIWGQLDKSRPVGMGIEKRWKTKKGRVKSAGHAMAILAAARAVDRNGATKEVSSGGDSRRVEFLGVIDPWGRSGAGDTYDILDRVDPGFPRKIPRLGIHWIPYEALGQGKLSQSFKLPAGWSGAKVSRWVFMDDCGFFNPGGCPQDQGNNDEEPEVDDDDGEDDD